MNMAHMKRPIIAIDGTAASGKSTTARKVAAHFRYRYIDTGAMYRAVTLKVLQDGIDISDASAVAHVVKDIDIGFKQRDGSIRVYLNHVDVTDEIRTPVVTQHVSAVSEVKQVRDTLVKKQRELGRGGDVVMEGRDIGTVVFPQADVKVFMDADLRERAKRRGIEFGEKGIQSHTEELEDSILERDRWDSSRIHSPLRKASDAQVLDTTHLTIEEQVAVIIRKVEHFLESA
jgi:cytidylate kinase